MLFFIPSDNSNLSLETIFLQPKHKQKAPLYVSFSVGSAHKIFLFIWKCLYFRSLKDLFLSKGFWVSSFFQHLNFSWLHFPMDSMKNTDINLTVDFWRVICLPLTSKSPFLSVVLVVLLWNDQMWFSLCSQGYRICGWHLLIVVGILFSILFWPNFLSPLFLGWQTQIRPSHYYLWLLPCLLIFPFFSFLMFSGFLVGIFLWAIFWATKFLLQ